TQAGTTKLEVNPNTTVGSNPYDMTVVGSKMYFIADGGDGAGQELWVTDGTAGGTVRISDAAPGQDPGVGQIGPYDGRVLYFMNYANYSDQLWTTTGQLEGTAKVADFCAEPGCEPRA